MTSFAELKDRIEAKRHELLARIAELKADSRAETREQVAKMKDRLGELEDHVKDGWDNLSDQVMARLNAWLAHSNEPEQRSPAKRGQA